MKWTDEQQNAIELRGKNILVSAAAGSGKTAVLVERIKRLIMEDGCSVDRMLIVTFTNAAAAEMKEKIYKAITHTLDEMSAAEGAGTGTTTTAAEGADIMAKPESANVKAFAHLKRQLDLLGTANISTFHAFALEVIRRYFYLINIEPDFKICDSTQETLMRGEAMDELLAEQFEAAEEEFFSFLRRYSGERDENRFRELMNNSYDTIRSLPEPFLWLHENVEQLKDGAGFDGGSAYRYLFEMAENKIKAAYGFIEANEKTAEEESLAGLAKLCRKDREQVEAVEAAVNSEKYEEVREALRSFKLAPLSSKIFAGEELLKDKASSNRSGLRKQIKDLKDVYFSGSLEELRRQMSLTYPSAVFLEKMLLRYDELYRAKKAEKNLADFADIEHYAYDILKDKEAADFYREKFEHIFIDEYQDNNVIQEALIDLIKRQSNLFMVGDVKQSIYKFRLAEPEIFEKKYRMYRDGMTPDSVKIDLNRNFRSKAPVIDFINDIFENVMDGYDDESRLYAGDPYAQNSKDEPCLTLTSVPWNDENQVSEELRNIMKAQKEALAAAAIIKEQLGTPIFDSKAETWRPLQKRDIVILMRGVRNYGDIFYKVLTENNLPAYVDDNDGFFNTMEIDSFLSALYVIDNPRQDVYLLTLLRSEMMGFSIEEMAAVRIAQKEGSYYDAFISYAAEGRDENLRIKCSGALQKMREWRELSRIMPIDKLIWRLMLDTDFYTAMGAMPAGGQRQANLRALVDKAADYCSSVRGSLYGFVRYIEAIKEKKVSMGQVKLMGEKDDLIRIMTVHKSKGLEFPMVLMAGYCRRLNYSTVGKAPVMHKDLGIGFPLVDADKHWYRTTLLQNMIKDRFRREEIAEEKRILYVALTRAKDKLILLGICRDLAADIKKVQTAAPGDESYFSMTGRVLLEKKEEGAGRIKFFDEAKLLALSEGRRRNAGRILKAMDDCMSIEISPEVEEKMSFEYPFKEEARLRTKYSVSGLNSSERKAIESLGDPVFALSEKPVTPMARGTVYHAVMEHMDILRARENGTAYVAELLEDMVHREMLTTEEAEIVEPARLADFALSDLGRRISESPSVEREKRFNMLTAHEGKTVMVRGIIDCFFEEDGELVLVDYKTGNMKAWESEVRSRYYVQMDLYRQALEKATGKTVKEIYLYLTDVGRIVKM